MRTKKQYYHENKKKYSITVFIIFDKYGVDNCHIELIENVNAHNRDELRN